MLIDYWWLNGNQFTLIDWNETEELIGIINPIHDFHLSLKYTKLFLKWYVR